MMNNTDVVNAVLSGRITYPDAVARVLPELQALEARRVRRVNMKPSLVVGRVLASAPKIVALREDIERIFRDYDFGRLERLEIYATAFEDTHVKYLSASKTPAGLRALASEGDSLRNLLMEVATPLVAIGLIDRASLESCQRQRGYKTIATDLGVLVSVLLSCWPKISSKCCVSEAELHRAGEISDALLQYSGIREGSPQALETARDMRNRAFTLLTDNYDEARRVVSYVRWHQGDLEKIAPSLSGGRTRHSRKAADNATDTSAAQASPNPECNHGDTAERGPLGEVFNTQAP